MSRKLVLAVLFLSATLLIPSTPAADPVAVRHVEGLVRGFLALRTIDGRPVATGDLIQNARGGRVTSRLVFHFNVLKVDIGGVAGLLAPILGKQPPDSHVWVLEGEAPAFVKSEAPLFVGGPMWRMELVSPVWRTESQWSK